MQMIEGFSRIDEEKLVGYVLSQRPTPLARVKINPKHRKGGEPPP